MKKILLVTFFLSILAFGYLKSELLFSWGLNKQGQLGDGTTTNRSSPVQIGTTTNWKFASGGLWFTMALRSDGTLWSWGLNTQGQLGDGTTNDRNTPIQVGTSTNWASVYSGAGHTLAIQSDLSSIEKTDFSDIFTIYPQPVSDEAVISFNSQDKNTVSIEIYNLMGTLIYTSNYKNLNSGVNQFHIDTKNYPSGLYNIIIKSGKSVYQTKMVKAD